MDKITLLMMPVAMATLFAVPASASYPSVYLEDELVWIDEYSTASFTVYLTERSFLDVHVPFAIDASSTATQQEDEDDDDNDFYIVESTDEDNGYLYDPETMTGVLIVGGGELSASLPVAVQDDSIFEGEEFIQFNILAETVTVARPLPPYTYTVKIIDSETSEEDTIYLGTTEVEVDEGGTVYLTTRLGENADEEVYVDYTIVFSNSSESDFDPDEMEAFEGTLNISEGSTSTSLSVYTLADTEVEGDEVFYVQYSNPYGESGETVYVLDEDSVKVTILDDDPTVLEWTLVDDANELTRTEGSTFTLGITLSGRLDEDVTLELSVGGSAIYGTEDDDLNTSDFYISNDLPLVIEAGVQSTSVTIVSYNDDLEEETETIEFYLSPGIGDDTALSVPVEGAQSFVVNLEDNDPVEVNIGRFNPEYDASDTDSEEPELIPASDWLVAEADSQLVIPIYLNAVSEHDITFDLLLDRSATTTTLYDPDGEEDQDWDVYPYVSAEYFGPDTDVLEVTVSAGSDIAYLIIQLNDDAESDYKLGDIPPEDVEGDEYLRITMANLTTESETVSLGDSREALVTIKELPDIDVTDAFLSLTHLEDNWVEGRPPRNHLTGLHELLYTFQPPESYEIDLTGYHSYRIVVDFAYYNEEDPDDPLNDELLTNPAVVDTYEEFDYFVYYPFYPRFPAGQLVTVLEEGEEVENEDFFAEENADVLQYSGYLLRPIDTEELEPDFTEPADYPVYGPEEGFTYLLDITNAGIADFPVERLDRSIYPDSVRVYLTRDPLPEASDYSTSTVTIRSLEEQADGSVLLEVDSSGSSTVQVQYLDEDGGWHIAHPPVISTDSSQFLWIDRGQPGTHKPPSEARFRIYRVLANP